ncbi:MAG: RIP metalloprotease RseP [bacterium]
MNVSAILEYLKITVEIFFGFGLVILFHEFGHFLLAKINGVEAPEFAFGMGPELFGVDFRGTRYKFCLFPIGGYVKMVGEEEDETLETSVPRERNFRYKKPWQKISIIFAGPAMNFVLAVLLLASVYVIWGVPRPISVPRDKLSMSVVIRFVDPRMPAGKAGFKYGDVIKAIDGKPVGDITKTTAYINARAGKSLTFDVLRNGKTLVLNAKPKMNKTKKRGEIGVMLSTPDPRQISAVSAGSPAAAAGLKKGDVILDFAGVSFKGNSFKLPVKDTELFVYRGSSNKNITVKIAGTPGASLGASFYPMIRRLDPFTALWYGSQDAYMMVVGTVKMLGAMITRKESADGVAGPVGIIQYAATFARQGLKDLIFLFGTISIGIGILNLFPFPALDGSRIVFHIWEAIIRKPLDPRREGMIHYVGFCILMALIVLVTFRDLRMWIGF